MNITVNSYFCGAGLMDIGLMDAGIKVNQAFELDADACKTYRHNLGDHVKQCDISQELVFEQDTCDGMVFTYPCTKYSTIGDIHGVRTGDDLFLHALRHFALAKPEFYVIENVPGMRAFPVVMEAMTRMPDYYIQVFCPIKSETWLPQKRSRLIIIGTRRTFAVRPPENSARIPLSAILEDDPQVTLPSAIAKRMSGAYRDLPIISDPAAGDLAPTCVAHYAKDKSTRLVVDKRFPLGVRPYSKREYSRLQGVPDWFNFPVSDTAAYKQIGNGVSVQVGIWVGVEMIRYMGQVRGIQHG
ncbi:MAG: DNA cytosine methyltransferase [Serratia marcescens]|uniref:DNA cytosine methyltransferase n=1 Tax=Serratia TaxID=613 RepID=UPI0018D6FE25|nr:DNA cytosine methyltransferase [Serratia ureilytica]MBH3249791.1 DNA cytosine methyltransferase [Serratia marcescens]MBJ2092824.1 DNA cytosine methyltransferase [Serratia ureilytica]MDU3787888.1 DNA cytosine methyltransferase [Serratia marcescens]MDU3852668.1 DNA cytosine methyltransferase [Serratia marcescens]HEJ7906684.1 DNA cytosine methyltransferase [Serratia marcescens]